MRQTLNDLGVTFTGSAATGAVVMRAVAPRVRPVSFPPADPMPGVGGVQLTDRGHRG